MGHSSKIPWTHHTFSPWIGCTKVSPGCENCYAETLMDHPYKKVTWGKGATRTRTKEAYWKAAYTWNRQALRLKTRYRVFPSLCDPFDQEVPTAWRDEFFELINNTPFLDWLLLTKRPAEMRAYVAGLRDWPWPNVWLGVSVEDQKRADLRIPEILKTPAVVRFLSVEPMLEMVDISVALEGTDYSMLHPRPPVEWVICGGESGKHRRPFEVWWAAELHKQAAQRGIPFFMKQDGAMMPDTQGRIPDDLWTVRQFPKPKPIELEVRFTEKGSL